MTTIDVEQGRVEDQAATDEGDEEAAAGKQASRRRSAVAVTATAAAGLHARAVELLREARKGFSS